MPIEMRLWRVDDGFDEVQTGPIDQEDRLEAILREHPEVLGEDLLIIGTQVPTMFGGRLDILAVDSAGDLVAIEIKRGRTPRDVAAQVLDYGSWIRGLGYDQVVEVYESRHDGKSFETAFDEQFGRTPPDTLNESHRLLIVASELDSPTERIVDYLVEDYGVPINAVFFRYFEDHGRAYLARTWLIAPTKAEVHTSRAPVRRTQEPWNGRDWYVSFGEGEYRSWSDAVRYGFISGGGAKWYTQTLYSLPVGGRVFVHIPSVGFVGVGEVVEGATTVHDFTVGVDGVPTPILKAPLDAPNLERYASGEPDELETFVRVEWEVTVPREQAYWETGMFANQNTACRLRNRFTLEKLTDHFHVEV